MEELDSRLLTRFEVIDETGRVLIFGIVPEGKIEASVQDDGRTLKVFLSGKALIVSERLSANLAEEEQREAVQIMTEAGTVIGPRNPSLKSRMNAALFALMERFEIRRRS